MSDKDQPERIYLQWWMNETTWCDDRIDGDNDGEIDTEYVRADLYTETREELVCEKHDRQVAEDLLTEARADLEHEKTGHRNAVDNWNEARDEIERLKKLEGVAVAFHDLAIADRNLADRKLAEARAEIERLKAELAEIQWRMDGLEK